MEIKPEVLEASLAGLLHEVGKLEQRSQPEGSEIDWTRSFIEQYVFEAHKTAALAGIKLPTLEPAPGQGKSISQLVALASKLSAGQPAVEHRTKEDDPGQMTTIFNRIELPEGNQSGGLHSLPLRTLELKRDSIFPRSPISPSELPEQYAALCQPLRKSAGRPIQDQQAYLENLLAALQRSAWCVPSTAYQGLPDISIYDHSRMTAALAACLVDLDSNDVSNLEKDIDQVFKRKNKSPLPNSLTQPIALLIGGDISGIQDFIYTLSSKGAARTLRGRSFYLQLLTEAVLRFVLLELGLPYSNVIYSGGGHFFLLAPVSAQYQLDDIRRSVSRKLLRHHDAALYLAIGCSSVPASGFLFGNIRNYWEEMHRRLATAKQQRYSELKDEIYGQVFELPEYGGNPKDTCSVCGGDQRGATLWDTGREEQTRICPLCRSFAELLGKKLPTARFVALVFGAPEEKAPGTAEDALAEFGLQIEFLESAESEPKRELNGSQYLVIWALEDPAGQKWPAIKSVEPVHSLRYMVNRTPLVADQEEMTQINEALSDKDEPALVGHPKTFTHLQTQAEGIKRLGVLRLDVDNLGEVIKSGLAKAQSLAWLSTLSLQMSLFFEGWVKRIIESEPYLGKIYAVYAGGDDVFLIGPWDLMPDLAAQIQQDFTVYTAENPALHLSAGMAFIDGKYPIYQAADDAAEMLEQAKNLDGKDAFSFLNIPWKWEQFQRIVKKKERLQRLVGNKELDSENLAGSRSILQNLRRLAIDEAEAARRMKGRPVWGPWIWKGAYQLTRMADRFQSQKPDLAEEIIQIRDELGADDYREINQWGAAARWVQFLSRDSEHG